MRLGIFGGSFDPPHIGHLLAATDAFEQLSLDRIIVVPAATQPLKVDRASASAEHRLAMTRLLVMGEDAVDVSDVEVQRAGLSFTVDTLSYFADAHPAAERFLLLGVDALSMFGQWRDPDRVMALARLAILQRGGGGEAPATLASEVDAARVDWLTTRRVDISSTEIRERVRLGKSIRGFVTEGVADYIARHRLYR